MEKLLQVADQHAVMSAPAESQIDKETFLGFMQKNLVWSFFSMSQAEYLLKSKEERVSLMPRYYTEMRTVRKIYFLFGSGFCFWVGYGCLLHHFFYLL